MSALAALIALTLAQSPPPPEPPGASAWGGAGAPPPAAMAQGSASDVQASATVLVEVGENGLQVQESWSLRPAAGKSVPAEALTIQAPKSARLLQVDPNAKGFKAQDTGRAVVASEPLTGPRDIAFNYLIDKTGSALVLERPVPFAFEGGRVIVQDLPGMTVSTSVPSERRTRELNGVNFAIYDIARMSPGSTLNVSMDGFPSHTLWPRRIAVLFAFGLVAWMAFALFTQARAGGLAGGVEGPLSARARRDRIVKAIEVLDKDLAAEKITAKKHERRYKELMKDLAEVLEEMARTHGASAGEATRSAEG